MVLPARRGPGRPVAAARGRRPCDRRRAGPRGPAEKELADIVSRAEGNAFFVEELTSAAAGPGSWVPADLADVLLVRLDRLDDTARQVVRAASVSGRRVAHDMLAAVLDSSPPRSTRACARRSRPTSWSRATAATPPARASSARRCTTTCCPASGSGHGRYVSALQEGRRVGHRRGAGPPRPARDGSRHRPDRQRPGHATRHHHRWVARARRAYHYQQAPRAPRGPAALCLGRPRPVEAGGQGRRCALSASGDPERAVKVIVEQLDRLPSRRRPRGGPGCCRRRPT